MAQFTVNATTLRSVQELQVPREVGRPLRRRHQQVQRAQAHDRGGRASRGRRPEHEPQVPGAHQVSMPSPSSAASPTTPSSRSGPTRCGTTGAAPARKSRWPDFRKDIIIDMFNEAGQKVISYKVYRCWVSEYQALPDLDANANAVAIQHIKLENEGWERDTRRYRTDRAVVHRTGVMRGAGEARVVLRNGCWQAGRCLREVRARAIGEDDEGLVERTRAPRLSHWSATLRLLRGAFRVWSSREAFGQLSLGDRVLCCCTRAASLSAVRSIALCGVLSATSAWTFSFRSSACTGRGRHCPARFLTRR